MRVREVTAALILTGLAAAPALAQGTDRAFVRGLGGVSFAANPSGIYGGGGGFKLGRNVWVTGEAGRIQDVLPQELSDMLGLLEQEVELETGLPVTLDTNIPVLFFLGGIRADVPTNGRVKPFIDGSAGVARLSAHAHAEVAGIDVSDEVNDVLKDENASKFMLALGGGVTMQAGDFCWIDVGYRYHRIATEDPVSNTSAVYAALRFAFK